jgi:pantoate--beta-alanine ligase
MILFQNAMPICNHLARARKKNHTVGFVPTMGALHDGHLALVETCKNENDLAVCSIFVNPAQFHNPDDFAMYPNTVARDIEQLVQADCSVLFLPGREEIYPEPYTTKHYNLEYLETILEGKYRPGHFQGVCQAVDRLLSIVDPHVLYLGQKDYQQCMVIKKLLSLIGKQHIDIKIISTKREPSGLAMSSRNLRLSEAQRLQATAIYKALTFLKAHVGSKPTAILCEEASAFLKRSGFEVDYVTVADAENLAFLEEADGRKAVGLIAATLGGIRLIDNMLLN